MKNIFTKILTYTILATLIISCKKDEALVDSESIVTVSAAMLNFEGLGGNSFKSVTAKVTKTGTTYRLVSVEDGSKRSINFVLNNVTATGKFLLTRGNSNNNEATLTSDNSSTDTNLTYKTGGISKNQGDGGGSVEITKLSDTEIEGTFWITAYNTLKERSLVEVGAFSGKILKK